MPVLDAYATGEDYEARATDGVGVSDSDELAEDLEAASRLLDAELGVHDGAFNSHTATYTFDAVGGEVLWLRDRSDRAYFLQAVQADGIGIDVERDGTFDYYTLDLNDAWVRGLPENASALSRPYTSLEILGSIVGAEPTCWPDQRAAVRINGTWGWSSVPEAIKALTITMTRELRDLYGAGSVGETQQLDEAVPLARDTRRLIGSMKRRYSRRLPGVG